MKKAKMAKIILIVALSLPFSAFASISFSPVSPNNHTTVTCTEGTTGYVFGAFNATSGVNTTVLGNCGDTISTNTLPALIGGKTLVELDFSLLNMTGYNSRNLSSLLSDPAYLDSQNFTFLAPPPPPPPSTTLTASDVGQNVVQTEYSKLALYGAGFIGILLGIILGLLLFKFAVKKVKKHVS